MADRKKVIDYALSQIGTAEDPLGSNCQKYGAELDKIPWYLYKEDGKVWIHQVDGNDWCTQLVDASFINAYGINVARKILFRPEYNNYGAVVKHAFNYFKSAGRGYKKEEYSPQPGDVIYFQNSEGLSHTGIVVEVTDSKVTTVEGNSGKNNWYVVKSTYSKTYYKIYGYGHPDYDEEPPGPDDYDGYEVGCRYMVICKDTLNVRTKAEVSDSATIVTELNPGTQFICDSLTRDSERNIWMRIHEPASGWIAAKYRGEKYVGEGIEPKTIDGYSVGEDYKVVAKKGLNVRRGTGKNYSIVKSIPYGTIVRCYDVAIGSDGNTWVRISDKEQQWCAAHYNGDYYLK